MFEKMCGYDVVADSVSDSVPTAHQTGHPTSPYIVDHDAEQKIVANLLSQCSSQLTTLFECLQVHSSVQRIVEDNVDLFMNPPDDFVEALSFLLVPIVASNVELIKDFYRVVRALMEEWQILMRAHILNQAVQKVFRRRRDVAQLLHNIETLMRSKNMISM